MPWTVRDVERHKHGLTDKQKKQWVAIANSVRKKCLAEGGTESQCDASAIRQANGVVGHSRGGTIMDTKTLNLNFHNTDQAQYTIRTEQMEGKQYIVVPVVMMVEGVHSGSRGPLLHTIDELGRFPDAWNGIPVVVNHPRDDGGGFVSANSPAVLEEYAVGKVFNTHVDGSRLRAEAWIDEQRLIAISPEAHQAVMEGQPLEVSVGVFNDEEPVEADWNGEHYIAIARNHRPDHLALLPGGVGACSWEDGCGIRVNNKGGEDDVNEVNVPLQVNALRYSGTESTAWSGPTLSDFGVSGNWNNLSAADKSKVASHYLIGSASAATFGDLKFPVVNPHTGKLNERALRAVISGRGAQVGGVSAETRAAARRRAYRLLNSEFNAKLKIPTALEEQKLLSYDQVTIGCCLAEDGVVTNEEDLGKILDSAHQVIDQMDSPQYVNYLDALYSGSLIYRSQNRSTGETKYYKQTYIVGTDNAVQLTGNPVEVQKKTEYIVVMRRTKFTNNNKGGLMKKNTFISLLITNDQTKFTEDDREWLSNLEDAQLEKLEPNQVKPQEPEINADAVKKFFEGKSEDEVLEAIPEPFSAGYKAHKQAEEAHVNELKKTITDNSEEWKEEDLQDLPVEKLEKLAKTVSSERDEGGGDYSALGVNGGNTNASPAGEVLLLPGVEVETK